MNILEQYTYTRLIIAIISCPLFLYLLIQIVKILFAKQIAIKNNEFQVSFFRGFLRLVLWEANQGVIILKNKAIWKCYPKPDEDLLNQGGSCWITPLRNEELKAHFPISIMTLKWEISDITTKEEIDVKVSLIVKWQINAIDKFIFNTGNLIRLEDSSYTTTLKTSAEEKIRDNIKSKLVTEISRISLAQIKSTDITKILTGNNVNNDSENIAKDDLAESLKKQVNTEFIEDGILIKQLQIEKIILPDEIKAKLKEIHLKTLDPIVAELDAKRSHIETQTQYNESKTKEQASIDAYIDSLDKATAAQLLMLKESKGITFEKREDVDKILKIISVEGTTKSISEK